VIYLNKPEMHLACSASGKSWPWSFRMQEKVPGLGISTADQLLSVQVQFKKSDLISCSTSNACG